MRRKRFTTIASRLSQTESFKSTENCKLLITKSMRVVAIYLCFAAAPLMRRVSKDRHEPSRWICGAAGQVINVTVDEQLLRLAASFIATKS